MTISNFKVLGMHCSACQKVIEKKISKIEGVSGVSAQLSGDVLISADHTISMNEVKLALEGTDYQVSSSS